MLAMNDIGHRARYAARLARVLDHIYDHLDEPLDIDRLAGIACLSPYHLHRIYQAMYGETVATTVRRLRLHRAAGFLANGSMPIAEIAERSGYSSLQSFTRTRSAPSSACRPRCIGRPGHTAGSGHHLRIQESAK